MNKKKINIIISAPRPGIGGGNRKYYNWYKNYDSKYFNKYYIYINNEKKNIKIKNENGTYIIGVNKLKEFIEEKKIDFFYPGKINHDVRDELKEKITFLRNIVFTRKLPDDEINLVISKTEYVRIKAKYGLGKNTFVVYNPVDLDMWKKFYTHILKLFFYFYFLMYYD